MHIIYNFKYYPLNNIHRQNKVFVVNFKSNSQIFTSLNVFFKLLKLNILKNFNYVINTK